MESLVEHCSGCDFECKSEVTVFIHHASMSYSRIPQSFAYRVHLPYFKSTLVVLLSFGLNKIFFKLQRFFLYAKLSKCKGEQLHVALYPSSSSMLLDQNATSSFEQQSGYVGNICMLTVRHSYYATPLTPQESQYHTCPSFLANTLTPSFRTINTSSTTITRLRIHTVLDDAK